MNHVLLIGLLMLTGCAADTEESGCAARDGRTYTVTFVEQSGNCGPVDDQTVVVDSSKAPDPGCTIRSRDSADLCTVTVDTACPGNEASGEVRYNSDSSRGTGTLTLKLATCQSTYAVTYTAHD